MIKLIVMLFMFQSAPDTVKPVAQDMKYTYNIPESEAVQQTLKVLEYLVMDYVINIRIKLVGYMADLYKAQSVGDTVTASNIQYLIDVQHELENNLLTYLQYIHDRNK